MVAAEHSDHSETSAFSITGKVNKITAEKVAKYIGLDKSEMTPQKFTSLHKEARNETNSNLLIPSVQLCQHLKKKLRKN